jgi:hypothetical protein
MSDVSSRSSCRRQPTFRLHLTRPGTKHERLPTPAGPTPSSVTAVDNRPIIRVCSAAYFTVAGTAPYRRLRLARRAELDRPIARFG